MNQKPGVLSLLRPYRELVMVLLLFTLLSNAINLLLPKIIANTIDAFTAGVFAFNPVVIKFGLAILFIFIFTYLQSIIQTYASERVAPGPENKTLQ
jgi:ATP-binding cassette subfamily B protein